MSGLILGRSLSETRKVGFAARPQRTSGELLTYQGDGHLVTFAPTGTGKTSSSVITNALTHPGQLIVLDMKGEVYAATAKARRKMGQQIHVIDLRDGGEKGSLNPLDLAIRTGTDTAAIGRTLAAELIERTGEERDRFWSDWSETMIGGGITWMLNDQPPEKRCLSTLFDIFTNDDVCYQIAVMLDTGAFKHKNSRAAFTALLQLPERETRPCVIGSVQAHLRLFDSELIRRLTDTTTIDLDGLVAGKPMSLYIIVPPMRLSAYRPLLRLWLSGLILLLTQRKCVPKCRTLMLVDEAGNLGRMDVFLTAATLLRSFGLTLWTFWQNAAQLSLYGAQANTLVDNAAIVQIFGMNNYRMAQDLANIVGGISADELLRLSMYDQYLLINGRLRRASQVRHYQDPLFTSPTPSRP